MLGIWEYFWDEADWIPAPIELPQANEARGSGKGRGRFIEDYVPADEEFWKVREEYLKSHLPQEVQKEAKPEPETEEYPELENLKALRKEALAKAQAAENRETLFASVKKVTELTLQIASLRAQYDEEALLLLLLMSGPL